MYWCKVQPQRNMLQVVTNLEEIYNTYFQKPYHIPEKIEPVWSSTRFDSALKESLQGRDVFLPITLKAGEISVSCPCATIRVQGSKTIVRTAVSERIGTVKEMFQVGDYVFTIKGVLIAPQGKAFPDDDIYNLRQLFESTDHVLLKNALSDMFLDTTRYVCITDLEFPEVEGKSLRMRPFQLTCESDYINSLIIQ